MQLTQKYNYSDLKRQDGAVRLYLTPDGESLPSVTTVLSKTKDKSGLDRWRKRVGEKTAEKIIADSAKIGTALHLYIEHYVNGDGYKDLTDVGKKAQTMAQVMVGLYKGRPAIIDFKQTNKPKKREWVQDYLMQLSAYAHAHNHLFNTEIDQGVILMCSRDLLFQRFELTGENFTRATDSFMKKLDLYNETII